MLVTMHSVMSHPPGMWEIELVVYFFNITLYNLKTYKERIAVLLASSADRTD